MVAASTPPGGGVPSTKRMVRAGGRLVPDDAWTLRKAASLVKLLALAPHHRLPRDQLLDTLWPDQAPTARARSPGARKACRRA